MNIPLDPPLIKGEDKKERNKFPPLKKGGQGGIFTVKSRKIPHLSLRALRQAQGKLREAVRPRAHGRGAIS